MPQTYNNGNTSAGGAQLSPFVFDRKVLTELRPRMVFTQLADVKSMPKNSGKEIKCYRYYPILDDRNMNDMGIDANGVYYANGNVYGSSKDVGKIVGRYPLLSELGGRVNRVGITRQVVSGTLENYGFFTEYTEDLMNFDSDAEYETQVRRLVLEAATEISEDLVQIDLLCNAGMIRFAGAATKTTELGAADEITYAALVKLATDLDDNNTPQQTTIITGTRMTDTKTVPACRVAYVGSELLNSLMRLKDFHGEKAFVPVEQYGAGTTVLEGERGAIAGFRVIVAPKMLSFHGAGAAVSDDFYATDGKADVFPFMVVGDDSFTTIGFQFNGAGKGKFEINHTKPGKQAASAHNPYGKIGFLSIQWWYGFMAKYPERIAVLKCTAKM